MAFEEQQPFDPASFEHIPVLLNECLTGLAIDPAGTYLDGTAGGAGHSRQIALRLDAARKGGRLISLDQDPDAVQTARSRLAGLPATVVQINFRYAGQALEQLGIEKINGALLDLGVSSHQLDDAARGFFLPGRRTAGYAHEPAGRDCSRPCEHRKSRGTGPHPAGLRRGTLRMADRRKDRGGAENCSHPDHPAAGRYRSKRDAPGRAPQEQEPLPPHLSGTAHCSEPRVGCAGRGLGYHFRSPCTGRPVVRDHLPFSGGPAGQEQVPPLVHGLHLPAGFPVCVCGGKAKAKLITRKPIEADTQELEENRRSRSAHLRVLEKC